MRRNNLELIPEEIGNCTMLTKLDISHNQLRKLPSELCKCKELKALDIRDNINLDKALLTMAVEDVLRACEEAYKRKQERGKTTQ